jgi:type I restriction enzyme S subunit
MGVNSLFKIVSYSSIYSWDVKSFFKKNSSFNPDIPLVLFGEFLSKATIKKVNIEDNETYKILGVRSYGKGAFINREVEGKTLKMRVYQQAKPNHLFWCKVDTKNGAFGIINNDLSSGLGSSNMTFAEIDTNKANVDFVQLYFKSNRIYQYLDGFVTGTTNRKYIRPDQLLNEIYIPLPSLVEQNRIIETYNSKLQLAEEQELEAKRLEESIEKYLFQELGIKSIKANLNSKGLSLIKFSNLTEWGVEKMLNGNNNILESTIYPNKKLSLVTLINPKNDLSKLEDSDEMSFIPMECVSDDYGEVKELRTGSKRNSSGYTKFQENDLIWARITPCMQNGKSTIVKGLKNKFGYGSTEFHVLRKLSMDFSLEFAYHLLRTKKIRNDAKSYFTGSAGQQRVPKSYLENLIVPIPPIKKQKEISTNINSIKAKIKELNILSVKNREEAILGFEKEIFKK